jgi:hypothetical protein
MPFSLSPRAATRPVPETTIQQLAHALTPYQRLILVVAAAPSWAGIASYWMSHTAIEREAAYALMTTELPLLEYALHGSQGALCLSPLGQQVVAAGLTPLLAHV